MTLTGADMARAPEVIRRLVAGRLGASAPTPVHRAQQLLDAASAVRIAALGSSRHAAGYGAAALDVFRGRVTTVLPAVGRGVPLPRFGSGDALVVVSQSGATPALVEVAAAARAGGTRLVAVVNDVESPLADLADVVLDCGAGEEQTVPATVSVVAQMLLLRMLAGSVPDRPLRELATAVGMTLLVRPAIGPGSPSHVVAGGFAAEWVADEVALKLAEMAGVHPAAESVVDYLHGPVATPGTIWALLPAAEPNAGALLRSADVVTLGPSPSYDVVTPTTGDDSLDAIVRVVVGQVLALQHASAQGVDPDEPRGLSKVTATL